MEEQTLPGGNDRGAVWVDGTVRRPTGPWTPAVHALLRHLEDRGFDGAPRVLGIDEQGREVLTFLPGTTVGTQRPWPGWVHSDDALVQVGRWLCRYHRAVADFLPPPGARWRTSTRRWQPGDVVGHNDTAPYNAVWQHGDPGSYGGGPDSAGGWLVGFVDWDFAGPLSALHDLAFAAFSWVPLHARDTVTAEGFTRFADRPRRLAMLLEAYGYQGDVDWVLRAVRTRVSEHAADIRKLAAAGDPLFIRLVELGVISGLDRALVQLAEDATGFAQRLSVPKCQGSQTALS